MRVEEGRREAEKEREREGEGEISLVINSGFEKSILQQRLKALRALF